MSEWRGLHNPDRHDPDGEKLAFCYSLTGGCGEYCWPERPCRCCLAAEVERLTADIADHWLPMGEALAAEVETLRARIAEALADVRALILNLEWDRDLIVAGRIEETLRGESDE